MLNDISKRLNELRLYGITETLDTRLESAYKSKLTYEELIQLNLRNIRVLMVMKQWDFL